MKILKLFSVLIFAVTSLSAEYITIKTRTSPMAYGGEEVFFGTIADYTKKVSEIQKSIQKNGINGALNGMSASSQALAKGFYGEGLKSIGAGVGIGLVYGMLNPIVMSYRYDQEYVLVRSNGNGELEAVIFIGDKHPSLSKDQIHEILKSR